LQHSFQGKAEIAAKKGTDLTKQTARMIYVAYQPN